MVKTRQGWFERGEVVQVWFDPEILSGKDLRKIAQAHGSRPVSMGDQVMRLDREQKYYLLQSPLKDLPLSETQACRVNATLDGDWRKWLSPSQLEQAEKLLAVQESPETSQPAR